MSNEMLIRCCAPTMASLKAGAARIALSGSALPVRIKFFFERGTPDEYPDY